MNPRVEIIAHRGSSHLAPENTLAAFKLGWQETTTCELDVQATSDGRLLVIHDDSTKRTTGADLQVAEHPLIELQQLDAGAWKGMEWTGEILPSLEEVIAAMPAGKRLLIEVKAGLESVPELVRIIRASGKEDRLLVHSFDYPVCVETKKLLPGLPVYLLIASRQDQQTQKWSPSIEEALAKIDEARLDGLGANDTPLLDVAAVRKIHESGLKVNVWTVDQVGAAQRLIHLGVDGIITIVPDGYKLSWSKPCRQDNNDGNGCGASGRQKKHPKKRMITGGRPEIENLLPPGLNYTRLISDPLYLEWPRHCHPPYPSPAGSSSHDWNCVGREGEPRWPSHDES